MPSRIDPQVAQQKKLLIDALLQAERTETYRASLAQQRLWFLDQLQGPTGAYNVHVGLWLKGALNHHALEAGLQAVVDRHESLRTSFRLEQGELLQVVASSHAVSLPITDLTHLTDPWSDAYQLARQEVETPFDLSSAPLFRARVFRTTPEDHIFLCTMHHIITDAWSMHIFTKELALFYEAYSNGGSARPVDLPIQYGDYSEWQRQSLEGETVQKQLSYWKETLQQAPPLLDISNGARPSEQTLHGASQSFALPAELFSAISSLAARHHATPFMFLLAAFKVLLYRYTRQPDVLVGVPVAGRNRVETEGLIGFFVDTVVLRDDLSGNPHFLDLLAQVRETTLGGLANADVPFEKVVKAIQPQRDLRYNPIFQVMFSVVRSAVRSHDFGNLTAIAYVVRGNTSIFDLFATFIEDNDRKWWLQIDYNTSLLQDERVRLLFEDYAGLLQAVVVDPETPIESLPLPNAPASSVAGGAQSSAANNGHKYGREAEISRPRRRQAFEPADEEQALLLDIWKEVLGRPKISIHDNFFDIGGHSLLAARLIAQIQDATGRKIPVSAVFRAPTVESFARLLKDSAIAKPDPLVMALHKGSSAIRFFAVAAPGVDTIGLAMLARHIGQEQSVYKLQSPSQPVWGRPYEKEELRALAREYVAAMRVLQPHGPYCMGGMCDGVLIAQEMILELEAQGEEVALFVIFDTWVLENSQIRPLWAIDYYLQRVRALPELSLKDQLVLLGRTLKRWAGGNDSDGNGWPQAYWPDGSFQMPRFRAPVLLFKRPRQPYYYVRDPQMGWGARSSSGVEICEVNCGHFEMLRQPHVRVLAERLTARLRAIDEQASNAALPFPVVPTGDGIESGFTQTTEWMKGIREA